MVLDAGLMSYALWLLCCLRQHVSHLQAGKESENVKISVTKCYPFTVSANYKRVKS